MAGFAKKIFAGSFLHEPISADSDAESLYAADSQIPTATSAENHLAQYPLAEEIPAEEPSSTEQDESVFNPQEFLTLSELLTRCANKNEPGPYLFENAQYYSRPEAVCGYMLQKYIRGYSVVDGKTFQVPVGIGKGGDLQTVDFYCRNIFLEYHPPRMHPAAGKRKRKFESQEVRWLRKRCWDRRIPKTLRHKYRQELRVCLTRQYMRQRMHVLSHSPIIDSFQLVVAGSPLELYRDFLSHHATRSLPRFPTFERDFKSLLREVTDLREKKV